jgi:hypothetical protein
MVPYIDPSTKREMIKFLEEILDVVCDEFKKHGVGLVFTCPICDVRCPNLQIHCQEIGDEAHLILLVHLM